MAGYVKLQRNIWRDPDFKQLGQDAAFVYLLLISQPDISHCGVLPLRPQGWAGLIKGVTVKTIRAALSQLAGAAFVMIDEVENELWVRSYMKHDEAFRVPNGAKAIIAAYDRVHSPVLRTHIGSAIEGFGVTLETRVSTTVTARVPGRDSSSQQPASISHNPAASSPTQAPVTGSDCEGETVAAAALDKWVEHRTAQERPTRVKPFQDKLRADDASRVTRYLTRHHDATCADVLRNEFGLTFMDIDYLERDSHAS